MRCGREDPGLLKISSVTFNPVVKPPLSAGPLLFEGDDTDRMKGLSVEEDSDKALLPLPSK